MREIDETDIPPRNTHAHIHTHTAVWKMEKGDVTLEVEGIFLPRGIWLTRL